MESPARSSRSAASTDRESTQDADLKTMREVESAEQSSSQESQESQQEAAEPHAAPTVEASSLPVPAALEKNYSAKDVAAVAGILEKMYHGGGFLSDLRVPDSRMSGCSECEDTDSEDEEEEEDDDICSTSSEESADLELPSGIQLPVLPDVQLRVPMEDEEDVCRVRAALQIKGVLEVVCEFERQVVTVTGTVPPSRLLKKVRRVNRQARILSTNSSFSAFLNPDFVPSGFGAHHETGRSASVDIPTPHPTSHQQSRPTFQAYTFHNSPSSPYLRTYSPPDISPPSSPPNSSDQSAIARREFRSSYFDEDFYDACEMMSLVFTY